MVFARPTEAGGRQPGNDSGFSLLEVLVAFAIAGLIIAVVLPSVVQARHWRANAQDRLVAMRMAARLVEESVASGKAVPLSRTGAMAGITQLSWVDAESHAPVRLARIEVRVSKRSDSEVLAETKQVRLVTVPPEIDAQLRNSQ